MNPPLFFLSYAHQHPGGPSQVSQQVTKFFYELSGIVADLSGLKAGEVPGFMDASIAGGRQWNQELLTAIGTSKVFVALLSPHYYLSEWCGKEWYAFAQREVVGGLATERAMLPVTWTPRRGNPVPNVISKVQRFSPAADPPDAADQLLTQRYGRDGLQGMTYMRDNYQTVVWRLASRIVEISDTHQVLPRILEREDLVNSFEEPIR